MKKKSCKDFLYKSEMKSDRIAKIEAGKIENISQISWENWEIWWKGEEKQKPFMGIGKKERRRKGLQASNECPFQSIPLQIHIICYSPAFSSDDILIFSDA